MSGSRLLNSNSFYRLELCFLSGIFDGHPPATSHSCLITIIIVRNAGRILRLSNQCETSHSENVPKTFAGSHGKVKRLLGTGAGLIFKGSGFYSTDYRSSSYKEGAKKEAGSGSSGGGEKSGGAKENGGSAKESPKIADGGKSKTESAT
jgi:predicted nucleic acid-binding Zn ribbon protein